MKSESENKINNYFNFKKNMPILPNDLSIVLFQLHEQLNIPTEIINNIEKHLNIMQLKKNIIFLSFYDEFIKIDRIFESNPPQYTYKNNIVFLQDNLEAHFYPIEPLSDDINNEDEIRIFNKRDNSKVASLTLQAFIPKTQINQDTIITQILNSMNQKINNEYKKLSYTDLIFIEKTFNATTLEDIEPILQWLPTIQPKKIERIIWSLLMEKAAPFWNTITINGKNFWDKKDNVYINHFIPKIQNRYALVSTNCIPIPQRTLMLILENAIKEKSKIRRVIYQEISFKTSEINIFTKKASLSVKFPHKKDPLYINQYTFPYAWVTIAKKSI